MNVRAAPPEASPVYPQLEKGRENWIDVPPVFIVGSARSGTTLLRLMLSAHPSISIASEGAYIYRLRSRLSDYGDLSNPQRLEAAYNDLRPFLEREQFLSPPPFEQLLDWVRMFGVEPRSLITFFGTWEARATGKQKLTWWGDNAPYHICQVPYFTSLFPTCRFILMVRDPRDAYASSKMNLDYDVDRTVTAWEKCLLDGVVAQTCLGLARVKRVKYEDLVTAPWDQLRDVCRFLDVEFSAAMLDYWDSPPAKAVARLTHHRNLLMPVFTNSIGRYREVLTSAEIATIHRRLYSPMQLLGYLSYQEYDEISCQEARRAEVARDNEAAR